MRTRNHFFNRVGETLLLPVHHFLGQPFPAGFLVQVFSGESIQFQVRGQTFDEFYEAIVEKWNTNFQRVGHGRLVADHQQVVREIGARVNVKHLRERVETLDIRLERRQCVTCAILIGVELLLQKRPCKVAPSCPH